MVAEKDGFGMVPLPMLKLETKSGGFDLSLVDMVIDIPVGYKRGTVALLMIATFHVTLSRKKSTR